MNGYLLGACIVGPLVAFEAFVLWRFPDFRRALVEHWRPAAVASRLDAWAERAKR